MLARVAVAGLTVLMLLVAGCGSAGEFTLNVTNESTEPIVIRGARPPEIKVAPGHAAHAYVSCKSGTVVTFKGATIQDSLTVGQEPALGGTEPILFVIGPTEFLVRADFSDFYGSSAAKQVKDIVHLTGTKSTRLPAGVTVCLPSEPAPQQVTAGATLIRVVRIPPGIEKHKLESFLHQEIEARIAAQRKGDPLHRSPR